MQISHTRTGTNKIPQEQVKDEPEVMIYTPLKKNLHTAVVYVAVVVGWLPV